MKKVKELVKGSFAKSVLMLTGGAVFAQAMNFLLSPVITRIYVPEDYGIMTVYSATLAMVNMLGSLSYELAIPIAEDDEKAINVFFLCFLILTGITSGIAVVLLFFGESLLGFLNASELVRYKWFLPFGFFGIGLYMIAMGWALRRKNFGIIAKTSYSQSIAGNATKIGLGLLSFGPLGLLTGKVISESAGLITLLSSMIKNDRALFCKIKRRSVVEMARRYVKFPMFSAPTVLMMSLSSQLPVILMSSLYGPKVVGLYGMALTVTFLPVTLIGKAIQDVFYGEAASIGGRNPYRIKELADKLMKKLILLAGVPMLVLVLFGPTLFSVVFGSAWYESGVYSRFLTVFMFTYFIFHPMSAVFIVLEQQRHMFFLNIVKLIMVVGIFQLVAWLGLGSHKAILIFSIGMAVTELIKYILAQRVLRTAIREESRH